MSFENGSLTHDRSQLLGTAANERHSKQLFYGWWVVLASAIGLFWCVPIAVYSFSVFFKPLMGHFDAGRGAVSLAFTLQLIAGALCAAPMGWLSDRYGPRRVILVSTAFFASILLANRMFSGSIVQFYGFCVLMGFAIQGVGPIPYGSMISHWFDRRRGLALGLTMLGIGLGAVIIPSLAQTLIARFGWNTAYSILGASVLLICWPILGYFLKEKPQHLGLLPDGASSEAERGEGVRQGLTAREAWKSADFWLMLCAFTLVSASVQGCVVHIAPMLNDRHLGARSAALGSSLIGAGVMIGRVGIGYLLDRASAARLASILFAASAAGIALLLLGNSVGAFAGVFLVGLGLGAEIDLMPYLTSRYFGLLNFGKVYSSLFAAFTLAGALGPLIMGAGFDRTGSYRDPLIVFLVAVVVAAILMTRLGRYRISVPPPENQPILAVRVADDNSRGNIAEVQSNKQL